MTSRRVFLGGLGSLLPVARWSPRLLAPTAPAVPSPEQLSWLDLELGMFVHFGPNTWQDREYDDRSIPPVSLPFTADPAQWAETAVGLGARYVILVAKHVGGFCLWQTGTSGYSVRNTQWKGGKGDVMAELAEACAARKLKLGVYLSPRDDHFGAGGAGRCATPEKQEAYNRVARQQLTELLTRYGPMAEVWFDGSSVVPMGDLLARYAKGAMVFQGPNATIRWVGNEDGFAPDPVWNPLADSDARSGVATAVHGDPQGNRWMPLEVDVSIRRPDWFWSTTNAKRLLTQDQLMDIYYRSIGRGSQLLLNFTPDRTGRIPEADALRAWEFGDEVRRRFGNAVGFRSGRGTSVTLTLPQPGAVDHVILQEDLRNGQRILSYRLEGQIAGAWRPLGAGTSVGQKRIHPITAGSYQALRVTFPSTLDVPVLRSFSAHRADAPPPLSWQAGASIWADNEVGRWRGGQLALDITDKVPTAGQYRLRFVASDGGAVASQVVLAMGGLARPALVRLEPGRSDVLIVTITGLGQRIELRGQMRGAATGVVLLRQI